MTDLFHPIHKAGTRDTNLLGGKGANLVMLARAGFPVPPGLVLTTGAYKQFFNDSDPDKAGLEKILEEAIKDYPESYKWAVRSSAADEDGADSSFAGQHDTLLNVRGKDALVDAVLACWASGENVGAASYREKLETGKDLAMAVVIQKMADAQCAGVLFTRHPVRPDLDRIVVEGISGLGEALVSGKAHPDRIELDRQGARVFSEDHSGTQCLDLVGNKRFTKLACDVEKAFGRPQDVEWAWDGQTLWVLQTRPITALKRPEEVWTRTWGDEFWAEATTPFQYTCLGRWIREDYLDALERINGWDFLYDVEPLRRIHGHVYFNAAWQYKLMHLMHPTARMERFFNWLPPFWLSELSTLPYNRTKILKSLVLCRMADKNANMFTHYKRLPKYIRHVEKTLGPGLDDDLSKLSDRDIWNRFKRNDRLGREHFQFIRWGLGSFMFPLKLATAIFSENWAEDPTDETLNMLLTHPDGNRTVDVNSQLSGLGGLASGNPDLVRFLTNPEGPSIKELKEVPQAEAFAREFGAFMKQHGHRGTTRELHMPRWMDDPTLVLGMIGAFAASGPPVAKKEKKKDKTKKHPSQILEKEWLKKIRAQDFGLVKALAAKKILQLARAHTQYRENQRYALDFILTDMRHVVLELARRMQEKGLLENPELVFFLSDQEFRRIWQNREKAPSDLVARKKQFEHDEKNLPPDWIIDGVPYGGGQDQTEDRDGITGTGASPGTARGPARVIRGAHELGTVRQGDILVAPNTDSGWTPVFGLVAGLVVQTGGILSHAAIVAREYSIPAITGVHDACGRIETGQILEIDGNTGVARKVE